MTKIKPFMPEVTYIKTPENQVKNCIIKHSNDSINADALNDLKAFPLFQKYADNPFYVRPWMLRKQMAKSQ
ncbi:hypothetical protein [Acinetobacter ursingii]|uniref:Uncharacterized protein n=1 Tax=Acinetobacter ursingii TaxID=108980 RepID=A0AA46P059_9GAMM|nr:hypothetical protein [Acinetobacter ursingii]UYF73458.1 hypothetical protein LSO60_17210 [Acinetobacter ursingii]